MRTILFAPVRRYTWAFDKIALKTPSCPVDGAPGALPRLRGRSGRDPYLSTLEPNLTIHADPSSALLTVGLASEAALHRRRPLLVRRLGKARQQCGQPGHSVTRITILPKAPR
jgi:hypothetical protein